MNIGRILHRSRAMAQNAAWRVRTFRKPYSEYQRNVMDSRSKVDPREAVGGMWDEIGEFQLQVLKEHELTPQSTVLDVGCGSLRGGRKIIPYLEPGNYWGTELSGGMLNSGREILESDGLLDRRPNLIHTSNFSFDRLAGVEFTHVMFWGVFTDVPPESVAEAIHGLPELLTEGSIVIATFGLSDKHRSDYRQIRFMQPYDFYERLAVESQLDLELVSGFSHRHPKGHSLLRMRLAERANSGIAS